MQRMILQINPPGKAKEEQKKPFHLQLILFIKKTVNTDLKLNTLFIMQ